MIRSTLQKRLQRQTSIPGFKQELNNKNSIVLDNVSDLTSLDATDFQNGVVVNTLGYSNFNDGGDARWKYVTSGLTANGYTIRNATGGGFWQLIHPINEIRAEWFGVVADGVTDNTAALRALAEYVRTPTQWYRGWKIYFPPGIIRTDEVTWQARGGLEFICHGRFARNSLGSATIFSPNSATQLFVFRFDNEHDHATPSSDPADRTLGDGYLFGLKSHGMHFTGRRVTSVGPVYENASAPTWADSTLTEAALVLNKVTSSHFDEVVLNNIHGTGLRFNEAYENVFDRVTFEHVYDWTRGCMIVGTTTSNHSATTFKEIQFEGCEGSLIHFLSGSNTSDFVIQTMHWEVGAGSDRTDITTGGTGYTVVPLFKADSDVNLSIGQLLTTGLARWVYNGTTDYAHAAIAELTGGNFFGLNIGTLVLQQTGADAVLDKADAIDGSLYGSVSQIVYGYNGRTISQQNSSRGKFEILNESYHGNDTSSNRNQYWIQHVSGSNIPIAEVTDYVRPAWNRFAYDAGAISRGKIVVVHDSGSANATLADIPYAAWAPLKENYGALTIGIRCRRWASGVASSVSIVTTAPFAEKESADLPDDDTWRWVYLDWDENGLNGTSADDLSIRCTKGEIAVDCVMLLPKVPTASRQNMIDPGHQETVADDGTFSITLPNYQTNRSAFAAIKGDSPGTSAIVSIRGTEIDSMGAGSNVAIASVNPDTDGSLNVYIDGNNLAIKNRRGTAIKVAVTFFGGITI